MATMDRIHFHIRETEWRQLPDPGWRAFRFKELLNRQQGGSEEYIFGYGEIAPGGNIPLHAHRHEMALNFLSGKAKVRLGKRTVVLDANSGAFFSAGQPHSIEAFSADPLYFVYTYACPEKNQFIDRQAIDEDIATQCDILNKSKTRWAVSEDFEVWEPVEPSKGFKLRARYLFDRQRGNTKEMCVSIFDIDGGCHYTHHIHSDPEIYYIISGHGTMRIGERLEEITPGSALYIGPDVVHGLDSLGDEPLHTMVIFGEKVNEEWTPVEDVYTDVS